MCLACDISHGGTDTLIFWVRPIIHTVKISLTIHHPLTPLQDSHYTWIRSSSPCRFGTKSDPTGLVWWKEGLQTRQSYWCENLVGGHKAQGTRQLRQPSIHQQKTYRHECICAYWSSTLWCILLKCAYSHMRNTIHSTNMIFIWAND